jgi:thiol-disulfide isomerase/thioredoxin
MLINATRFADLWSLQELASEYKVAAMPTLIAFLDGKKVGEVVGLKLGEIEALIQKYAHMPFAL